MYRTYVSDLTLLMKYTSIDLLTPLSMLSKSLKQNIEELKKEHWESRNGDEIIYQLIKYFEHTNLLYLKYFDHVLETYHEICSSDKSNHYIGKCCLFLTPFLFVLYISNFTNYLNQKQKDKINKNIQNLVQKINEYQPTLLSIFKINELVKEMKGFPNINNKFIKQGILLKLNKKKGLQNRLVFLFDDLLAYGSRISSSQGFRLHGLIQTSQMELTENNHITGIPHSFIINVLQDVPKILLLAAFNEKDKEDWLSSISCAIKKTPKREQGLTLTNYNSSEEFIKNEIIETTNNIQNHRSNATTHVCWHRNLSINANTLINAHSVTISGYLLRKFKNSPGWQRLWVVYTNICLYFYKTHGSDDSPLASLPLLGYRVDIPSQDDNITKDHVFKLSFKNHVYFFRAESPFTFQRWVSAIKHSTTNN